MPIFPDVPLAQGVPPVPRAPFAPVDTIALLVADAVIVARMFQASKWGIFDSAMQPVVIGDSVLKVGFRAESRTVDYPVERGAFGTYNKVQQPYDARLTFTCGGSFTIAGAVAAVGAGSIGGALAALTGEAARSAFLVALDKAQKSFDIYSIVTPDVTYPSANIVHYDYERTERNGATMLTVDVWLAEIRQAPDPQFTSTKQPSGADPQNGGTVQTVPVTQTLLPPPPPTMPQTFRFG